jgi:hypothetical protein
MTPADLCLSEKLLLSNPMTRASPPPEVLASHPALGEFKQFAQFFSYLGEPKFVTNVPTQAICPERGGSPCCANKMPLLSQSKQFAQFFS